VANFFNDFSKKSTDRKASRAISDYVLKLNVAFFSHWRLEAHIQLHCHPEYWWGHSHWCPHQPKYWWGYIPGGIDAYDQHNTGYINTTR